jgi:hypothetical protein
VAPRRPLSRIGEDRYALRLDAQERRILGALVEELRQAMRERDDASEDDAGAGGPWPGPAGDPDDPLSRLYPPAFPDDDEAETAWAALTRPSLDDARNRRLDRMAATIDADELDEAAAAAWLGTLNDLRLVIGAQLGITEDEQGAPRSDDPDATRRALFDYLGWLVDGFVDALAGGLPEIRPR